MTKKAKVQPVIKENIENESLDQLMGEKYALYAKDVIQDRAIPDARDGLKPVQRRIIFDMWNMGNTIDKPTKKCAHIVGDVMGKYHPHGDSSIYEALVHMSQPWAYRYPLIDFQGNNGSIDGDGPAAYRYTEARLSALSNELIADIDKNTVDMQLTFDDTLYEPTVLPAKFPNLLVNGSEGIAVGIATSIPPHNLHEVVNAIVYRIKHPDCEVDKLLHYLPGPDFPTGGIIYQSEGLKNIYRTGRGRIVVDSKCEIVTNEDGKKQIIISEIPYQINKSILVKSIDKIRHDKIIAGIEEVRDETDKEGLRIAIDLKDDCKPEAILAYLYNKTQLRASYTAHMVAIVDGRPKTMNLASYCDCYIEHQLNVITRRSQFLLKKDQSRLHIVSGLIKAISVLDEVVKVIKASRDKADSKINIEKTFGFTEDQAEAIVMMPLYKLSHTDISTLIAEEKSLEQSIVKLNELLSDKTKREEAIISDLHQIAKKYGDKRKTEIKDEEESNLSLDKRDLIPQEDVYVVATRDGYLKRSSVKSWRGSGGQNGTKPGIKSSDAFIFNGLCQTTDFMLIFTSKGNYLFLSVNEIKEAKWNDEGFHISSLVKVSSEEKLIKGFVVRHFRKDLYLVLLTRKGVIKRICLDSFPVIRRSKPISAIHLLAGDSLVDVVLTSGNSRLFVTSENAKVSYYNENEIAVSNPRSSGIKAGMFEGAPMAGLLSFAPREEGKIIIITDRGHTRVYDMIHAKSGHRLDKTVELFSMFKKEPHRIIYLDKVGAKTAPFVLDAILSDETRIPITFENFNLTPMERYAKRPPKFPTRQKITHISREDDLLIDDSTPAYAPAKKKETDSEASLKSSSEETPFEQISLFETNDSNKKK